MKTIKSINLSFEPKPSKNPKTVSSKQLDNLTRSLSVRLDKDVPETAAVVLRGKKPNSLSFEIVGDRIDNSEYIFRLDENALAVAGRIVCDVVCTYFENGSAYVLSTEVFFIENVACPSKASKEELENAKETIPSIVESALADAKESGTFDGKTAYMYAVEGGYKGSEEEFAAKLAEELPRSLSDLEEDATHKTVSQEEKASWNEKVNKETLDEAISDSFSAFNMLGKTANAIKNIVSGDIVRIDDILPERHIVKGIFKSRNLIPRLNSSTVNGVTFDVGSDGTVDVYGTARTDAAYNISVNAPAGIYTFSLNNSMGAAGQTMKITVYLKNGAPLTVFYPTERMHTVTFTASQDIWSITIRVSSGVTFANFSIKPQLELGGKASEYSQIIETPKGAIKVFGKNILPANEILQTSNGFTAKPEPDGMLKITGKCEDASVPTVLELALLGEDGRREIVLKPNVDYTLTVSKNGSLVGDYKTEIYYPDTNETIIGSLGDKTRERVLKRVYYEKTLAPGNNILNGIYGVQLEVGQRSDFSPYTEEEYASDENGNITFLSNSPCMTAQTDEKGVVFEFAYSQDSNAVIKNILAELTALKSQNS